MIRLLLFLLLALPAVAQPIDLPRLAEAIRQAENTPHWRRGRAGERSEYQITRPVWQAYSTEPFNSSRAEARRVALRHLAYLEQTLPHPTPYRLALAWNAGYTAASTGNVTASSVDYANRVRNLYGESPGPPTR